MDTIRFGIIGTGNIASKFARACAMTPGVCAAGVSSRSAQNGARFAEENGVEHVYRGAQEMVDSADIDIVYVATPHTAHFENCMLALRAGKHVLCEKPMATRREDAERLFAEAKARGLFLMEGMWSRFLPNSLRAKEWIETGRIGAVKFIDAMFSFAVDPRLPKRRLVDPALGGGAMFDLGVYTVEMASYYAGADPMEWSGFCDPFCPGTDATAAMALQYPGGVLATLRMGITCEAPVMMTVYGEKGRIELPRFFVANEARLYEGELLAAQEVQRFELPEGFCWQIEAVREYLKQGVTESPVVPAAATIAAAGVLENMMHRFFPDRY